MRRDYSDSFLKDMAPPLADHYASLLDVCREAVREAADRMESLVTAAADASDVPPATSATGWELFPRPDHPAHLWTKPLRDYTNRSGKLLRPYLVCLCLEAYGKDPAESRSGSLRSNRRPDSSKECAPARFSIRSENRSFPGNLHSGTPLAD